MNKRTEQAAKRFFYAAGPNTGHVLWDYTDHKAKPLILAAFHLYAKAWTPLDVRQWDWPFTTLAEGQPFTGDQPWTVLLRRAVEIMRAS